jgi:hypothetical protein
MRDAISLDHVEIVKNSITPAPLPAGQFSSWNIGIYEMPTIAPSGDCNLATV